MTTLRLRKRACTGLLAGVLAGCGTAPLQEAPRPAPSPSFRPGQPGAPGQPPQAAPGNRQEGQRLLSSLRQALAQCTGIAAEVTAYSRGYYYGGKKEGTMRVNRSRTRLTWAKSNRLRGEVLETTAAMLQGAVLATQDGRTIKVRAKGALGLVPLSLSVSDPKLLTNRNHTFADNNPQAQLARLTSPEAVWQVVGKDQAGNVMVEVSGVRRLDNEIDREVITLDPRTGTPRALRMFARGMIVVENTFERFSWNPRVSSDTFSI